MNSGLWLFLKPGSTLKGYWDERSLDGVARAAWTVLRNLAVYRFADHEELLPLYLVWHVTLRCNLACAFCDDGNGRRYPTQRYPELKTSEALRLLELLRDASTSIFFTGGEPFMRKDFPTLLRRARALRFWPIMVTTNGSLRAPLEQAIEDIDLLVISLGAADAERYDRVIGRPGQTAGILRTLVHCAKLQNAGKLRVIVNCVISADRYSDAREVLAFCLEHGLWFSPAPEVRGLYVDPRLLADPEYERLVADTLAAKGAGAPIYGSVRQLELLLRGRPFRCYPTLTPRVYPNGDLSHPCHPLGQHTANVLGEGSYGQAWRLGARHSTNPVVCGDRCHLPCYVSNAQWMEHPMETVIENARVVARSAGLGLHGRAPQ
jgi:MoaA/NifB/PqqE/SkfB family radical SAM enzyme